MTYKPKQHAQKWSKHILVKESNTLISKQLGLSLSRYKVGLLIRGLALVSHSMIDRLTFPSEPISDQCEIESRIKALKEELKKRKFMAYQLKEEQKKRHKERLKAQEASLLKQLEVNVCLHLST